MIRRTTRVWIGWPYSRIRKFWRRHKAFSRLKQTIRSYESLKVILGAGGTACEGWLETDINILNICKERDWRKLFRVGSIDNLLVEHVFEHLSISESEIAFKLCHKFLKSGRKLRIAVPDGYRKDAVYVAEVTPPKDGHKQVFNIDSLSQDLKTAGFEVEVLEYFDKDGNFHFVDWSTEDGKIWRSKRFDKQTDFRLGELYYTSLIVDAIKR